VVVADNCQDDTATIAKRMGVHVLVRNDSVLRGKGFALAHARDWLRLDPPDLVVVLDADCSIDRQSLADLLWTTAQTNKPAQAIYLLEPSVEAAPMVQVSTFAFMIKNLIRQRGLQRLAGGVHLTGTGMCLPWQLFDQATLATSNIVEDILLGVELTRQGRSPQLARNSLVRSVQDDAEGTLTQRQRWEGGYLDVARSAAPQLLRDGLRAMSTKVLMRGLDLLIPPLALLILIDLAALLVTAITASLGVNGWSAFLILLSLGLFIAGALAAAWLREGRRFLSAAALVRIPFYVLWKLPMYVGLARKGAPTEWLRTRSPNKSIPHK
jgi:cellulose synthase/poly-beta-1,6-N-acetylglucosamine synthase-like glycosyltransferase